jgi:hypothetical protein
MSYVMYPPLSCDQHYLRALQHLEFLGANEFDNRPFIVMPYLKNGNARDYVLRYPDCDRLQIV